MNIALTAFNNSKSLSIHHILLKRARNKSVPIWGLAVFYLTFHTFWSTWSQLFLTTMLLIGLPMPKLNAQEGVFQFLESQSLLWPNTCLQYVFTHFNNLIWTGSTSYGYFRYTWFNYWFIFSRIQNLRDFYLIKKQWLKKTRS